MILHLQWQMRPKRKFSDIKSGNNVAIISHHTDRRFYGFKMTAMIVLQ